MRSIRGDDCRRVKVMNGYNPRVQSGTDQTGAYGRGGFFIHGGFNWGSAGCIDIKEGDAKLNEFLSGLCDCYVPVKVNYVVKQNKLSEREVTWYYTIAPYGVPYIR